MLGEKLNNALENEGQAMAVKQLKDKQAEYERNLEAK